MQAITTKYLPPTNRRISRVKAQCEAGAIVLNWDNALNVDENHAAAANALRDKLGWNSNNYGQLIGGAMVGGGYCFVFTGV
jgi:hypothetical protein